MWLAFNVFCSSEAGFLSHSLESRVVLALLYVRHKRNMIARVLIEFFASSRTLDGVDVTTCFTSPRIAAGIGGTFPSCFLTFGSRCIL